MEFACRLYFSLPLSVFLTLYSFVSSRLLVLLTSMSVSFSVSIDRSCIRLLSPLFSLLCSVLGVWVTRAAS